MQRHAAARVASPAPFMVDPPRCGTGVPRMCHSRLARPPLASQVTTNRGCRRSGSARLRLPPGIPESWNRLLGTPSPWPHRRVSSSRHLHPYPFGRARTRGNRPQPETTQPRVHTHARNARFRHRAARCRTSGVGARHAWGRISPAILVQMNGWQRERARGRWPSSWPNTKPELGRGFVTSLTRGGPAARRGMRAAGPRKPGLARPRGRLGSRDQQVRYPSVRWSMRRGVSASPPRRLALVP